MKQLYLLTILGLSLFLSSNLYSQAWDPIGPIDANHPFPFKDGNVYFTTALDNNGLQYTAYPNFNDDAATIVIKTFNTANGLWENIDISPYTENGGRDYVIQFDSNNVMYIGLIGEVSGNYERALVLKKNGNNLELVGQADITGKKVSKLRFRISDDDTLMIAASSINFIWNNQSQNSGLLNMYSFDGTNWNQEGQEINIGYTNSYFLDLEFDSSNEAILGHTQSTGNTTYFKKLSGNSWVDYKTTPLLTSPGDFILTGINEDIIVTAYSNYQAEVWLDDGGFTKLGTVSTTDRSFINEIENDNNGDVVIMGASSDSNSDDRLGFIKRLDPNTPTWNMIGPGMPIINSFSYTDLLFDAQNIPTISYFNSSIGVSRKLNASTNSWDYLGTPGILEMRAFGAELDSGYDNDENLYVLQTERDNGAYLNKFNTATNTWENEATFLENIEVDEAKLIITKENSNKFVALRWRDPMTYDDKITVFKNENNAWVEVGNNAVLELVADEPDEIQFKVDASNTPIITYWDDDDEEYIKVRKLINNSWETIGNFNFLDDNDNLLEIEEEYGFAINNAGIPFLALMHDDYDKIKLFKYGSGTDWAELDIMSLSDSDEIFDLNIADDNTIYLAYEDDNTSEPSIVTYNETSQELTNLSKEFTQYDFWGDLEMNLGADDIPIVNFREDQNNNTRAKFKIKRYNATDDIWESLNTDALADTYWDERKLVISPTNKLAFVFDHGFVYAKGFQAPFTPTDADEDGVRDSEDTCPDTPEGEDVDENGCSDSQKDTDDDGVNDANDQCSDTPEGVEVDENGCSDFQKDEDGDGIGNADDTCDNTPIGQEVDENGCSDSQKDTDNDGVSDDIDQCNDTPVSETVDEDGCSDSQKDADNDGVNDTDDECSDTPEGETADEDGCSNSQKDTDSDGINDAIDECIDTPSGNRVDNKGCTQLKPAASGFTPNGDGNNDQWVIPGIENYPNNIVRVYNRWGNEVFSAQSYENNWEGFYKENNEKLPAGQYMYIIELGDNSNPIQGWIFLNY